jgi:hypothetical protein
VGFSKEKIMKPGWRTSEFWITLAAQVIAVLTVLGVIPSGEAAAHLQDSATKCIIAVFVLVMNGIVVLRSIEHRSNLKQQWLDTWPGDNEAPADPPSTPPDDAPTDLSQSPKGPGGLLGLLLVTVALGSFADLAQAQSTPPPSLCLCGPSCRCGPKCDCPGEKETCFGLLRRNQGDPETKALLQQLVAQQGQILALLQAQQRATPPAAPAPQPQIIVLGQPLQQLPIAGQPLQQLPIAGQPLQQLPITGQPKQDLPTPGAPKQDLPTPGAPKQDLPPGSSKGGPLQTLPTPGVREERTPGSPTTTPPVGFQRYSVYKGGDR